MRWWIGIGLIVLFIVRIDLWLFDAADLVVGLPVGLAYHLTFCFVVAAFFACVVKFAWPHGLDTSTRRAPSDSSMPPIGNDDAGSGDAA